MTDFSPIPRPHPPQPKSLGIDPPTYTVPDVTLMFDSDDSLIWKPGEHPKVFLEKLNKINSENGDVKRGRTLQSSFGKIDSVLHKLQEPQNNNNDNSLTTKPINNSSHSPIVFSVPISKSNKSEYNPSIYASPKLATTTESVEIINQCIINDTKQKTRIESETPPVPHTKPEVSEIPITENILRQMHVKTVSFEGIVPQNNEKTFSSVNGNPPFREQNQSLSVNQDSYILKLIEGQNQQILYLHKVLEKILEKLAPTNNQCTSSTTQSCQCCYFSRKDIIQNQSSQKVAIVQTSISEAKPESKTVGTNTDLMWTDMKEFFVASAKKKEANESKENANKTKPQRKEQLKYLPLNTTEAKASSISHGSTKKETSLSLAEINMETAYDPPSPDPSLQLNVPDYKEEESLIEASLIDVQYSELEGKDFPKVGESALVYGERLRNEARFKENQPESQQDNQEISIFENDIGTTLYNNAIKNVQQILGKPIQETEEIVPENEEPEKKMIFSTNQKKNFPLNPQQFGISFLDPLTFTEKPSDGTIFDTFYLPAMMRGANLNDDLEVLDNYSRHRRHFLPTQMPDDRLIAIAGQYSGQNPPLHLGPARQPKESDFSFATKQFLGKYELDK